MLFLEPILISTDGRDAKKPYEKQKPRLREEDRGRERTGFGTRVRSDIGTGMMNWRVEQKVKTVQNNSAKVCINPRAIDSHEKKQFTLPLLHNRFFYKCHPHLPPQSSFKASQ